MKAIEIPRTCDVPSLDAAERSLMPNLTDQTSVSRDERIDASRRRLVRGSLAAPVVMTVAPGAAMANSSNFQCIANPPPAGVAEAIADPIGTNDRWYRIKVSAYQSKTDVNKFYFIDPNNASNAYLIQSGNVSSTALLTNGQLSSDYRTNQTYDRYVVKLFSNDGVDLGLPRLEMTEIGGWASFGCFTSFTGG